MLQTPTSSSRDAATAAAVAAAQKKKGIKSSLGRFFSKKEKVRPELMGVYAFKSLPNANVYVLGEGRQRFNARWISEYDVDEWNIFEWNE